MLAISTSWNEHLKLDPAQWVELVKALGFEAIELGYTLTAPEVEEIIRLAGGAGLVFSSIHNFAPIPDDEPSPRHPSNHYRLSALDKHERAKAVEWTNKTIDVADRIRARAVVIHAGTLDDPDPWRPLLQMYKDGEKDTAEFFSLRERLRRQRAGQVTPYREALEESLALVLAHAKDKGIRIGLETRYYPLEIPNFEEIGYFLNRFQGEEIGYWHDVGHAEVNERLGLQPHRRFLEEYGGRMIGIHLHGMKELRDHLAPFEGDMDLSFVLPFCRPEIIRVVESRYATVEQMKAGLAKLPFPS